MNVVVGWLLAGLALAMGYWQWGWQGLVLAVTLIVFWLLLQFNRAVRAMRKAAARPVGEIDNAVMLHARLHHGQRLPQILALTRSLGVRHGSGEPEVFEWRDAGGDVVRVELESGKLARWQLRRADPGGEAA